MTKNTINTISKSGHVLTNELYSSANRYSKYKHWILASISFIILISRLFIIIYAKNTEGDDGKRYLIEAENLLTYNTISYINSPNPPPTAHDTPIFILLVSLLLRMSGDENIAFFLISGLNAIFFTLAALGVCCLTNKLFQDWRIGIFASGIFAILPETIAYSVLRMPDSLFLAFFIWAYYLLLRFIIEKKKKFLITSFILLSLSILTKPIGLYFIFVAAVLLFFLLTDEPIKKRFSYMMIGFVTVILIVFPWLVRNYVTFHAFSLATITNTNVFYCNYGILLEDRLGESEALKKIAQIESELAQQYGPLWGNPFIRAKAVGVFAKKELLKNLPQYLMITLKRHPRLYIGTGTIQFLTLMGDYDGTIALQGWINHPTPSSFMRLPKRVIAIQTGSWFILGIFYILTVFGLLILLKNRKFLPVMILGFVLTYFVILIGPLTHTRYRLPIDLFASPLAAFALIRFSEFNKFRYPEKILKIKTHLSN